MVQLIHEFSQFEGSNWINLFIMLAVAIIGIGILLIILFKGLRQLKLSFGKDGVKLNDTANGKLDCIIDKLQKLEKDVVALQIMNEQITPCERIKLYDYYKHELHGNSFIDVYIQTLKAEIDTSRFA